MKTSEHVKVLNDIYTSLNQGYIYVNNDKVVEIINNPAKQMLGITLPSGMSHPQGKIEAGDIVILADNDLGNDDMLTPEDLSLLGIKDKRVKKGDSLLLIGKFKSSFKPVYKSLGTYVPENLMSITETFDDLKLTASIDLDLNQIVISVDDNAFEMEYIESVGHMVILDGSTHKIKFFQCKGYGFRGEEAGEILRGKPFYGKNIPGQKELVPTSGINVSEILGGRQCMSFLETTLESQHGYHIEQAMEIFKRWFLVTMVRDRQNPSFEGVHIFLYDRDAVERQMNSFHSFYKTIESKYRHLSQGSGTLKDSFPNIIGSDSKMLAVKELARKAASTSFNVIITGESGTGKSRLAREIHDMRNPKAPFVMVSCNAIAPTLIESELFGYAPSSFTGANRQGKSGYFEEANGGTIFLDEIGEIPPEIQVKLLNVLQYKRIYRVGSTTPIDVDVRVITATNRNLAEEVSKGNFRQDLFYRINVFPIHIPPLRERNKDINLLANSILSNLLTSYGMKKKQFSHEAMEALSSYKWPGNVRELENIIERAIVLCDGNMIYREHLLIDPEEPDNLTDQSLKSRLIVEEKRIIKDALDRYKGDKTGAMNSLGISKTRFYEKIKRYGLEKNNEV